jgi:hypothetical protein
MQYKDNMFLGRLGLLYRNLDPEKRERCIFIEN